MDLWKDNNLKAGEIGDSGEWDFGLTSSFWKWYIYIYFLSGSLNVCFIALLLKQMFLFAVLPTVKTNEGHSLNAAVKKGKKITVLFCPLITVRRCMWLRLSVCESVFVRIHPECNMELLMAAEEHFNCLFSLVLKKKDHLVPFLLACNSHLTFFYTCASLEPAYYCLF